MYRLYRFVVAVLLIAATGAGCGNNRPQPASSGGYEVVPQPITGKRESIGEYHDSHPADVWWMPDLEVGQKPSDEVVGKAKSRTEKLVARLRELSVKSPRLAAILGQVRGLAVGTMIYAPDGSGDVAFGQLPIAAPVLVSPEADEKALLLLAFTGPRTSDELLARSGGRDAFLRNQAVIALSGIEGNLDFQAIVLAHELAHATDRTRAQVGDAAGEVKAHRLTHELLGIMTGGSFTKAVAAIAGKSSESEAGFGVTLTVADLRGVESATGMTLSRVESSDFATDVTLAVVFRVVDLKFPPSERQGRYEKMYESLGPSGG